MRRRPVRRRMRERCLWLCVRGVAEVRHGVRTILLLLRELLLRSKVLRRMYHLRRCGIAARRLLLLLLLLPLLLLLQLLLRRRIGDRVQQDPLHLKHSLHRDYSEITARVRRGHGGVTAGSRRDYR